MSNSSQHHYVRGDEYLPDKRLPYLTNPYNIALLVDGLTDELRLLSHQSDGPQHQSGRPSDGHQSSTKRSNSPLLSKPNSASDAGNGSRGSTHTIFSASNSGSSSTGQSTRQLNNSNLRRQLSKLPSQSMLDRWMGQTTKQDPFHGLTGTYRHHDQAEAMEKRSGKQRAHKD